MNQQPQREVLADIDSALAGIRGMIAQAMALQKPLSRRQLKYIKHKIRKAHYVAEDQIPTGPNDTTIVKENEHERKST